MKRIIAMLIAALLTLSLASCTITGEANTEKKETGKSDTTAREGFEDVTVPPDTASSDSTDSEKVPDTTESAVMDNEKAVETARRYLGETDEETGYKYAYSFDEMMNDNGTNYYKIRVAWYIEEEERYSTLGYLLVDENGNVTKYDW